MKNPTWLSLLFSSCSMLPIFAGDERPNIIVMVSDDSGWADVGFHGERGRLIYDCKPKW